MDSLGSEIGQKMRSAVKAKLIELGTGSASGYIDDELPDYVMIMVANKRSRQQMIDDLTLFLGSQTDVFVNWLHQVLQKLEEVTLPASSVTAAKDPATKAAKDSGGKRKGGGDQKDKKDKKRDKKTKKRDKSPEALKEATVGVATGEHTPPHPTQLGGAGSIQEVFANQYIQQAKKTLEIDGSVPKKETLQMTPPLVENTNSRNDFDIPTISEIAGQSALQKHQKELSELEEIQQKIKQAKKQLRSMGSDESEDEDFLNIKANDEDLENFEDGGIATAIKRKEKRKTQSESEKQNVSETQEERSNTPPAPPLQIIQAQKKKSIMERLGTRLDPKLSVLVEPQTTEVPANKSNIISLSAHRREERELYIPVFRRKEMEEQAKAREASRSSRANRSRSRDRERRRSPASRSLRRESSRDRSRNRREREREHNNTRSRDRGRERERDRQRERELDRSSGKEVRNGADIRTRIGSRVIVLPPKPEYNEEDELEVPIPSVVKIQPRPQVPKSKQPSKNLLLKAMAEAQRSTTANLKKTISNREDITSRPRRMLIEIPGAKAEGTPPVDVRYEYDEDDEVDIVNHVLGDDDVDDELQQILDANDEYIPEPVTVSISGRSDTDSDGYVYVPAKKPAEQSVPEIEINEYDPKDPSKNPKFVVTLDGAYKKSSRSSPSHTPPPPGKTKISIKDRIGYKVPPVSENSTTPPRDHVGEKENEREHQETLKRRKERFSLKSASSRDSKRSASKSPGKRSSSSKTSSKKSPSKRSSEKRSSNSSSNNIPSSTSAATSTNRKSSPSDLNELLLQRTKELLVDDSVSSSPIYMSKSDYEKIEPNSSSRKRKRVSPIQFELTDDEADDSDGEYNHHRDREHRERKPVERANINMDDGLDSVGRSKDQRRDRETERRGKEEDRRKSGGSVSVPADSKSSPTKKIKKLESSRKFDDVPQLLSSVSVPSDGLSKSKGIIKERCKYFPQCRQGDSCEFLHPSTMCKSFPACKFGDKCLYLHPFCKYDKTCHRLDCTYMHSKPLSGGHVGGLGSAGPSAPPLASSVVPVQNYKTITAKPLPALCKFYPGCTNGLCPYYHPKMCRFGKHCMNKVECNFYHHELPGGGIGDYHEVPSKDKFKWVSPFSA